MPKRKHSVGYFSSYDRGLECLLDMWPKIREQVPDATLDIYYGWQGFDFAHKSNPVMMKWRWVMTRKIFDLKGQGVTENGRVDHLELAKAMKSIKVWAYPTEFTEINCITALKAQEAGCIPVTTLVAALAETVHDTRFSEKVEDIYHNEGAQARFIEHLVNALSDPRPSKPVPGVDWSEIAKEWENVCALQQSPLPTTSHV